MSINNICQDVRQFLRGLAGDLPEIFPPPRVHRGRFYARRRRPQAPRPVERERARQLITARVEHWAETLGLDYRKIFIKNQSSMWGSCSGRKNLNFNWRLAAAPPEALDYVVIHELCHLREMNHSKDFWALVKAACPDYAARRKWLKHNCAALYALPAAGGLRTPDSVLP